MKEKIGAWLLEGNHTKAELAGLLSMSTGSLSNKISGETDWTWKEVKALALVLGCQVSDFVE